MPKPVHYTCRSDAHSDVGRVRTVNEDSFLARPKSGLWVVADGMGGHTAGDLASGMVVDALAALEPKDDLGDLIDQLEDSLEKTNTRLRELAASNGNRTIGTTVVTLVIRNGFGICMWAGDSRIYRLRNGELEQITQDHALVEELVLRGMLSREEAEHHPQANLITRAVGAANELFVDVEIVNIQVGDQFLLCSDGLTREVSENDIKATLSDPGIVDKSRHLIEQALDKGARDNTTAIVVSIDSD